MDHLDELYCKINNLLSGLRAYNAVKLIADYYAQFGNDAPTKNYSRVDG